MSQKLVFETKINKDEFIKLMNSSKNSLWNIAVLNAPYRTGNLRANIKRSIDENKTHFVYDNLEAAYIDFLEEGKGRNKRHIGFIENRTVNAMIIEIMTITLTGKPTFSSIPSIQLRTDKLRNYEKKIAKGLGIGPNERINAAERASLSFGYRKGYNRKTRPTDGYKDLTSPKIKNTQEERWSRW